MLNIIKLSLDGCYSIIRGSCFIAINIIITIKRHGVVTNIKCYCNNFTKSHFLYNIT